MKQIKLDNFRCYSKLDLHFRSGVNLLIGDNASGKTSILKACKYVLSTFFAGFSDENTRWINPTSGDFRQIIANGVILPENPIAIHFTINDTFSHNSNGLADYEQQHFLEEEYCILKGSKKNSRSLISGIKGYKLFCQQLEKVFFDKESFKQVRPLPLFACFSTEDIHSSRKINESKFKQYNQKNSFGYYECLEGNGFLNYWLKRLLILEEAKRNTEEITIVKNAIIDVLGNGCHIINNIEIRPNQKKIYFIFSDGREVEAEHLSDGYRRIVNIVIDLAFRCALLNRSLYGLDTCKETKGTVLIDEIDMHLHPSLQSCVLNALRRGFPAVQFIATTHAPMVMSGVRSDENNIVYKLSYSTDSEYKVENIQTYGMDVSTITQAVLNQTPRNKDVDNLLARLFLLIEEDKAKEAEALLNTLKQQFGDALPDLAKAETMLNFLAE